jgi:putative FmdB family regulatory protein
MPMYDYKCNACDELYEKNVKIANMNDPQECPFCGSTDSLKFIGGAPSFGDSISLGRVKPSDGFRDVLRKIHDATPGSILKDNNRYI